MGDTRIIFYPVGNGDCTLIQLDEETNILIDINIRAPKEGEGEDSIFDVIAELSDILPKDNEGRLHLTVFALTHPDQDHCRGFRDNFYLLSENLTGKNRIIIDELWFTPRAFKPYKDETLCEDAESFRKEANRRLNLHKNKDATRNEAGNCIKVLGYTTRDDVPAEIQYVPGQTFTVANSGDFDFEVFVHAPFKESDEETVERNDTSLIVHLRFISEGERVAAFLTGGDAACNRWKRVIEKTKNDEDLEWDLFKSPHHCSYKTFHDNDRDEAEKNPDEDVMQLINMHSEYAHIISSSWQIPVKDEPNQDPPHLAAAKHFRKAVGEDKFLVTMEPPKGSDEPEPIVFVIRKTGAQKKSYRAKIPASPIVRESQRYG